MASTNITTFPGKVGVSNANPTHTLAIGSNVYVDDTGSNKLTVTGVISGDGLGISNIQTVNVLGLTDNVTRIGTLETDLDNNSSRISTVSTDLSDNSSRISTVSTDLSDNSSRISTVSTDLADNSSRISTVSTDLSDNSSRISTVSTDLSDNSSRITSLESGASSISGVKTFQDDIILESNLRVKGDLTYANTVNMIVSDPIIELGANNQHTNDLGLVLTRHGNSGNDSNVAIFYDETADTLKIGYTDDGASQTTLTTTTTGLDVSITGNVAAAYDTDETSYFGRAAVGYMGQSDQASFSHLDKNTSANFALKQAASGATHLNTPTGQHIRFSVNASEVGRFTGGGDFEVGTSASTKKLIVDTSASEVQMYSQATGSTAGPDLVLMRDNPNNGANNEYIGQIRYEGLNDNGNSLLYAKTTGKIKTATNGSEDGVIETMIKTGGSNRISVRHSGAKFLIQKGTDLQVGEVANLYVDTSTSRVGINVASPSYTLDVGGDVNLSTGSTLRINGIPAVFSNWTANGSDIYRSSGNVGIGTDSPGYALDVHGTSNVGALTATSLSGDGSGLASLNASNVSSGILTRPISTTTGVFTSSGNAVRVGPNGGGQVGLTINDGDGNCNLTFNHASRIPDQNGSSGRIDCGVDDTSGYMRLRVKDNVTGGTSVGNLPDCMRIEEGYVRAYSDFYAGGNVGIGTTSPLNLLHLSSDNTSLDASGSATFDEYSLIINNTRGSGSNNTELGLCFNHYDTSYPSSSRTPGAAITHERIDSWSKGKLHFKTKSGNTEAASCDTRMTIDAGGNIGIGTVSPTEILHLAAGTNPQILVEDTGDANRSEIRFKTATTDWCLGQHGGDIGKFKIANNTDVGTDTLVTIDQSGNVGIGTTSPGYKLHVAGDINFTGTLYQNGIAFSGGGGGGSSVWSTSGSNIYYTAGKVGIGTTSPSTMVSIDGGTGVGSSGGVLGIRQKGDTLNDGITLTSSHSNSVRMYKDASGHFHLYNTGGGQFTLQNVNGNVGIGTTSPGAKLDVNGYIAHNNPVFYAHNFGNGGGGTTSSNYIVYRNTEVNVGSNFSTSTGIFTCPRNGVYKFTWGAIANNSDTVYRYYIRINNANIINGTHNRIDNTANGSNFGNGTSSIILTLSTNDTVRIFYIADNGSTSSYGYNYDIFMGYMISA